MRLWPPASCTDCPPPPCAALLQVVSLHCNLDPSTHHLMNKARLEMMKKDAVLVNAARGPCIDEAALVAHLQANPDFRCGLDVFEDEPAMKPGLEKQPNAVIVPHIASASLWTRSGMVGRWLSSQYRAVLLLCWAGWAACRAGWGAWPSACSVQMELAPAPGLCALHMLHLGS